MNLYQFPNQKLEQELTEILLKYNNVRIERIVSDNHTTDWYDQEEDEWICLLTGEAEVTFENHAIALTKGDTLFIPKHEKHRVSNTTKCIWLCVFIG